MKSGLSAINRRNGCCTDGQTYACARDKITRVIKSKYALRTAQGNAVRPECRGRTVPQIK